MKSFLTKLLLVFVSLLLTAGILEVGLRLKHSTPEDPHSFPRYVLHEPDLVLGWKLKPGSYADYVYLPGGEHKNLVIRSEGARTTGAGGQARPRILSLGCSYLFGWGLSDNETFLYQVQKQFPAFDFLNFGTSGYGAYQSFLLLEKYFRENKEIPKAVLYFWIEGHDIRNVGSPAWLKGMMGEKNCAAAPFCRLKNGELKKFPPTAYPAWPFEKKLCLIRFIKEKFYDATWETGPFNAEAVAQNLTLEMARLCAEKKVPFGVVVLEGGPELGEGYTHFLERENIPFADCTVSGRLQDTRIKGDGHPNAKLNGVWAECLERNLPEMFPEFRERFVLRRTSQ